jgi:hypothetical protein
MVTVIMRTRPLRSRLAQELGPAQTFAASDTGIWLGPWEDGRVAIGLTGTLDGIRPVISRYGAAAQKIYYPYPAPYQANMATGAQAPQLLLMVFRSLPPT